MKQPSIAVLCAFFVCLGDTIAQPPVLKQEPNTWVKRSPLPDAPVSPSLGYEGSFGYDPLHKVLIRWAGHNQGGGGEQNAETWTFDPVSAKWALKEANLAPPGACCNQQNVFDPVGGRFLRFQAFSGSHGWQWYREIYMNNTAVWSYDLAKNTWRDMRSVPAPRTAPLRSAAWDSDHQVVVIFGGEGSNEGTVVYDPFANTWTRMNPPLEPAGRSSGNLAYDAEHKLHILFGTQFANDQHTWAYDLRKNAWRDLKPKTMPPTDKNDAVLAYDVHNKVIVCNVNVFDKAVDKENVAGHYETWTFDVGKNEWKKMNPPQEPQGWGSRRRIMAYIPDQNVTLMESYVNPTSRVPGVDREQQIWTYRYADTKELGPAFNANLKVTTLERGAVLMWQGFPGAAGYIVFRGEGSVPWQVDFREVARVPPSDARSGRTVYSDDNLKPGLCYHYFVQAVGKEKPGPVSVKARTQPVITEVVIASVLSPREVSLTWPETPAKDVVGYHVERAVVHPFSEDEIIRLRKDTPPLEEPSVGGYKAIGPFIRLTKEPIKGTTFTDAGVDLTKTPAIEGKPLLEHRFAANSLNPQAKPYRFGVYAYRVRAVNKLGVEAGPGPYALTIPSSPQWLFSKEEGATCHLKWAANPEKGIKGYRVYRMESPRINGPGQPTTRLTADPVADTRYTDAKAGDVTRRYWVVAVDALGQEGFPSAPTWHQRQYRKYYVPFTGEWHQ